MASASNTLLDRQVRTVRRRLLIQACINRLIVALVIACALTAMWVLAKPYALGVTKPGVDWAVGGGIFAAATLAAIVLAVRQAPSAVDAALSLDHRFNLRERVTTTLTMRPDEQVSPAGRALRADAEQKVGGLNVGQKFPVNLGWHSALVPAAAAALALLIVFYDPVIPQPQGQAAANPQVPADVVKELEQKKQEYLQKQKTAAKTERPKSDDVKAIEAKIEEIMKKPMATEKDLKDRLSELTATEEAMRKKEKEEADKVQGFQDQLQKMNDQLQKKSKADKNDKDGAAKDLKDQLGKGNLEKAKEEAERLSKKIKDGDQINKKDKEQLANELKDMKDELKRLAREKEKEDEEKRKEKEDELKKQEKEGKIDKEQLDREIDKLKKDQGQTAKEMQDLADKLERAEQALNQGKDGEAAQALQDAAQQLDEMAQREQNLDDIQGELQRMQDLREAVGRA